MNYVLFKIAGLEGRDAKGKRSLESESEMTILKGERERKEEMKNEASRGISRFVRLKHVPLQST